MSTTTSVGLKGNGSFEGVFSKVLSLALDSDLTTWCPSDWDNNQPQWWAGASPKEVSSRRMRALFLKKFVEDVAPDADAKAEQKFLTSNKSCSDWNLRLESDWDKELYGTFRSVLYRFWHLDDLATVCDSWQQIFAAGHCGPGLAEGVAWENTYNKLSDGPMTATSEFLVRMYEALLPTDPTLQAAEYLRRDRYGVPCVVQGGRLGFAPKRTDISRTISKEPSLNMFFQLGLAALLEARLKTFFGINLQDQPEKNRELSRRGSVNDDLVTIDLSEASNTVGLRMVRQSCPRGLVQYLEALRCDQLQLSDKEWVRLDMVSTMGNGVTFPLETLIFASIVVAAYLVGTQEEHKTLPLRTWDAPFDATLASGIDCNFGVFGDDIICSREAVGGVLRLLDLLGFKVNRDKSFVEGPFRESCGADMYLGKDVAPVYVKKLGTLQDRYAILNSLTIWTAKTGIPLRNTCALLLGSVPFVPVPRWEQLNAGVQVPSSFVLSPEFSRRYQGSFIYKAYRACTDEVRFWENGRITLAVSEGDKSIESLTSSRANLNAYLGRSKKNQGYRYNPFGLLHCLLGGMLKGSPKKLPRVGAALVLRQKEPVFALKPQVAPAWDSPSGPDLDCIGALELPWETAAHFNLAD